MSHRLRSTRLEATSVEASACDWVFNFLGEALLLRSYRPQGDASQARHDKAHLNAVMNCVRLPCCALRCFALQCWLSLLLSRGSPAKPSTAPCTTSSRSHQRTRLPCPATRDAQCLNPPSNRLHGDPLHAEHIQSKQFVNLLSDGKVFAKGGPLVPADAQVTYRTVCMEIKKKKMTFGAFLNALQNVATKVYPKEEGAVGLSSANEG